MTLLGPLPRKGQSTEIWNCLLVREIVLVDLQGLKMGYEEQRNLGHDWLGTRRPTLGGKEQASAARWDCVAMPLHVSKLQSFIFRCVR